MSKNKVRKMDVLQARMKADDIWSELSGRGGNCIKVCESCKNSWRLNGAKREDKPPIYPSAYNGKCLICRGNLVSQVPC